MTLGNFSVTLTGYSYMDLMSALVGAYFYQIVWYALAATGIALLPFFSVVAIALREALERDNLNDDVGQQWGRYWVKLAVMLGVMIFAAAPTLKVTQLKVMPQMRQCDAALSDNSTPNPVTRVTDMITKGTLDVYATSIKGIIQSAESSAYHAYRDAVNGIAGDLSMGGKEVRVPVWWLFVRQTTLALGSFITAQLPCDNGLRVLKHEISTNFIQDPALANELGSFMSQCTSKAKARLQASMNGVSTQLDTLAYLPNYPWYLGTSSGYQSIRATKPVWGFGVEMSERGHDSTSAPNSALPPAPKGYGYPMCDVWWSDSSLIQPEPRPGVSTDNRVFRGLEDRLYEYYGLKDPSMCGKYVALVNWRIWGEESPTCDNADGVSQNVLLTAILNEQLLSQSASAVKAQKVFSAHMGDVAQFGSQNKTGESSDLVSGVFGVVLDFGLFTSAWKDFAGNLALLKAMPIAASVLILVVTAVLPLGMIVGRYELEPLMGMTLSYFAFLMWIPYFRMIKWLDDNFVGMVLTMYQPNMAIMLEMMIAAAYIAVPLIIGTIFTVAGAKIAQLDPIGAGHIGSVANQAATNMVNMAMMAFKKGQPGKGNGKGK